MDFLECPDHLVFLENCPIFYISKSSVVVSVHMVRKENQESEELMDHR